jgi:hypothetical protein
LVVFLTPRIITGDEPMEKWDDKEPRGLREYESSKLEDKKEQPKVQ